MTKHPQTTWKPLSNETPLTFLLALTFLFLFSGSVYGDEPEVKRKFYDNGKLEHEIHYKNGKAEGLATWWYESGEKWFVFHMKNGEENGVYNEWYESGRKKSLKHYKNGIENGIRKEWDEEGTLTYERNYIDGVEEIK